MHTFSFGRELSKSKEMKWSDKNMYLMNLPRNTILLYGLMQKMHMIRTAISFPTIMSKQSLFRQMARMESLTPRIIII